jgi:hypothetical protein
MTSTKLIPNLNKIHGVVSDTKCAARWTSADYGLQDMKWVTILHGVTPQKTIILIFMAVRILDLTWPNTDLFICIHFMHFAQQTHKNELFMISRIEEMRKHEFPHGI